MQKISRRLCAFLIFVQILALPLVHTVGQTTNATPTRSDLYINYVKMNPYDCTGYNIGDSNYYQLRHLAREFKETPSKFDVRWDEKNNAVNIITGQDYDDSGEYFRHFSGETKKAVPTKSKLLIDGSPFDLQAYNIGGNNYFKLRDLGKIIPFGVEWEESENKIMLYSTTPENSYRVGSSGISRANARGTTFGRWEKEIKSYIFTDSAGNIATLKVGREATNYEKEKIIVTTFDKDFKITSRRQIPFELESFGAFYSGKDYNYIAFGQNNPEENDSKEVVRIVRYDKDFDKVDDVRVRNCFTIAPFEKAARMDENDEYLVLHMGRTRYTTDDGLNHQSQLTIIVEKATMRVVNDLGVFQKNHVSHSFNQFVKFDGNNHVLVDHGDAYPRSIVLNKYDGSTYSPRKGIDLFAIPGKIGANCTGVSVGGFEVSNSHYLVAINSIDHSLATEYTDYLIEGLEIDQRNIILCAVPKQGTFEPHIRPKTLAKYVGTNKIGSIPHLVKISGESFMVLWQEFDINKKTGVLRYVFLDGSGNPVSQTLTLTDYVLSECQPIVYNGSVVWATDYREYSIIHTIPLP